MLQLYKPLSYANEVSLAAEKNSFTAQVQFWPTLASLTTFEDKDSNPRSRFLCFALLAVLILLHYAVLGSI